MRTAENIDFDIAQAEIEMRSLSDKVNDRSQSVDIEAATRELEAIAKRKAALKRELAELSRPQVAKGGNALITRESLLKAAAERRSLVIGDTGAINQIRALFKEIADNDDLLSLASYYYGPNASTNIPVLTPMSEPEDYNESATTVAHDTQAEINVAEIQPKAHASILTVTAEMLQMGAVDIEAELPDIFAKAFATKMHKGMLTGNGTEKRMKGIFTSAAAHTAGITKAAGTNIKITELAALALAVAAKDASFRIIMSPAVYQGILSDDTDSEDIKIYKEGLIRDKSIEGVPILLDPYAPVYEAENDILAVACPLNRYAIGIAGELTIEPIRVVRDTQTYYQAIMFFSGMQVSDTDLHSISAGKASGA